MRDLIKLGFDVLATPGTAQFLEAAGITEVVRVQKIAQGSPNVLDYMERGEVKLVINTPSGRGRQFDEAKIRQLLDTYPTPFHIYDERAIRENARRLNSAFSWCDGFRDFFAVKATPNPHLLRIVQQEGFGADCSRA